MRATRWSITCRHCWRTAAVIPACAWACRRAHALLLGRDHVLPEDVQALFAQVAAHRLVPEADAGGDAALARSILQAVPVD